MENRIKKQIEKMDYLQYSVYKAMCKSKNENISESYAREFALNRIKKPIDLVHLDYKNQDLLAEELGCTPYQMDVFIMVTKAIYNSGKCEQNIEENRAYAAQIEAVTKELFKE